MLSEDDLLEDEEVVVSHAEEEHDLNGVPAPSNGTLASPKLSRSAEPRRARLEDDALSEFERRSEL